MRPLIPTVRDAVTGEFVLPQVIAAARSGPEGGFVEYFWDDPSDDSDRADIPKVGYARAFTGHVQRPDGSAIPVSLIVGSGFYGSAPGTIAADRNTVVESVLPQVVRAMTASAVDAVSDRIEQAASGAPPAAAFSLGGASTLPAALLAHGQALGNGTADPGRLLAGSSFTVSLDAAGDGGGGPLGRLTFWGSGDYRSLSGGSPQALDYDGSVASASVGIDTRLGADLLAGAALSRARGTVDYTGAGAPAGELTASLTSISPYVGWGSSGGMNFWAMAGLGSGEVEIDDAAGAEASDLTQRMAAAGGSAALLSSDRMIAGGDHEPAAEGRGGLHVGRH